jgi:hypothetical protein
MPQKAPLHKCNDPAKFNNFPVNDDSGNIKHQSKVSDFNICGKAATK